jgi:hypothetical protein
VTLGVTRDQWVVALGARRFVSARLHAREARAEPENIAASFPITPSGLRISIRLGVRKDGREGASFEDRRSSPSKAAAGVALPIDRPSFVLAKNRRFVGHVFSSGADRYSMKESWEAGRSVPANHRRRR